MADYGKKPLIDANLITEFGGIELTSEFINNGIARNDYTYVPGFSEMRVNRDLDLARLAHGDIKAKEVATLEWNARWYRCANKAGDPDTHRTVAARNEGYRAATKDDLGKPWMTDIPPGGYAAPDGTIRNAGGDLQLFVCDKANAAKNAMLKKIRTEQAVDGIEFTDGGLGKVGSQVKGADPYVEKTTTN